MFLFSQLYYRMSGYVFTLPSIGGHIPLHCGDQCQWSFSHFKWLSQDENLLCAVIVPCNTIAKQMYDWLKSEIPGYLRYSFDHSVHVS